MSNRKVNSYPSEFRESSIKLALESDQPIAHTAKNLGINVNTLHVWISKYGVPSEKTHSLKEHHFDEIKRLKRELAQVRQERDLLKKAAAYFAKETL